MMRWIASTLAALVVIGALGVFSMHTRSHGNDYDGFPHLWFAWHPVRLQGGKPIPTVQTGGRVVWLKNIERTRLFGRWVYREIGDKRELMR